MNDSDITRHMHERLHERVGRTPYQTDQERCQKLWRFGREATEADHQLSFTWPQDDCAYRIAVGAGATWMIVRSISKGVFVTIIRVPDRRAKRWQA